MSQSVCEWTYAGEPLGLFHSWELCFFDNIDRFLANKYLASRALDQGLFGAKISSERLVFCCINSFRTHCSVVGHPLRKRSGTPVGLIYGEIAPWGVLLFNNATRKLEEADDPIFLLAAREGYL